jgi:enoyl-CoA hydratase/carnithine racemase
MTDVQGEPDAAAAEQAAADRDTVLYEVTGGVALLTLNRPDRLNAWTLAMEDRYFDLLLEAEADERVRAIVVTGAGRGFSAGADLQTADDPKLYGSLSRRPTTLPLSIRKPIIAAVNGPAAGVSLVQALQCDLRFVAEGVKLTFAFPRRGLVAEHGVSWLLPRLIGTSRALDLLLSGRVVLAEEALAMGLVNRVEPADELLEQAMAFAAELAAECSPASMAVIKQQVYADWENDLETSRVRVAGLVSASLDGPDVKEGIRAFMKKRPVAFAPLGEGSNTSLDPEGGPA